MKIGSGDRVYFVKGNRPLALFTIDSNRNKTELLFTIEVKLEMGDGVQFVVNDMNNMEITKEYDKILGFRALNNY